MFQTKHLTPWIHNKVIRKSQHKDRKTSIFVRQPLFVTTFTLPNLYQIIGHGVNKNPKSLPGGLACSQGVGPSLSHVLSEWKIGGIFKD